MDKDEIKKSNELLDSMIVDYLEKCSRKELKPNSFMSHELEVSFGNRKPITRTDYENVIYHLMRYGWKTYNIHGDEMLRINSEYVHENDYKEEEPKVNVPAEQEQKEKEEQEVVRRNFDKEKNNDLDDSFKNDMEGGGKEKTNNGMKMRMSTNFRLEIVGARLIQEYCKHDSIDAIKKIDAGYQRKMKFTEKKRVLQKNNTFFNDARFTDHNFRVAYKLEKDSSVDYIKNPKVRETVRNWSSTKKTYRCMNRVRFGHADFPIFVDVSVIKTNSKTRPKKGGKEIIIPTYTLKSSNAFSNEPHYEIELELDNNAMEQFHANKYNSTSFIAMLKKCIRMVLSGLQDTPYPVSYGEQDKIYEEYMTLIHGSIENATHKRSKYPEPTDFIGPQSISLQQYNLYDETDVKLYNEKNKSTHVSVIENYMATEKADGQRAMLYISKEGKIYMINSQMKIIFTGSMTKEEKCFNSLLDGEFIMTGKNKEILFLYAAFDIYYIGSRKDPHVRQFAFYPSNADDIEENTVEKTQYRLLLLQTFVNMINVKSVVSSPHESCLFRIQCKQFSMGNNIFDACKGVLSLSNSHPYETDGLILTPIHTGVGSDKPEQAGPLKKHTWNLSFKWKPPQYNTIDFYVMTEKDKNRDAVKYLIHDSSETMTKTVAYKTLFLHVGFNKKTDEMEDSIFQRVLEDKVGQDDIHNEEDKNNYVPRLFKPTTPYDPSAYICYIPLDDQMRMKTVPVEENGTPEVFEDLTIVEFRYAQVHELKEGPWRWIPIRVRHDKTAVLRSANGRDYGNAFKTANSNWRSIHYPVTEDMISGVETIHPLEAEDDVYYDLQESNSKHTKSLKHFHNKYVKYKLISSVAEYLQSNANMDKTHLIDYSVGRAGDLPKWKYSNVDFVFGIDLSKDNVITRADSASARYLESRKKYRHAKLRALFLQGDSSRNIRTKQDAFTSTLDKQLVKSMFGTGDPPHANARYVFRHGFAREGFHISSCQFALHYFFESLHTLHRFLRNVSECTRVNGYFIGTCYDGKDVFNALQNEYGTFRVEKKGKILCEITKKYDRSIRSFPNDEESVGMRIDVFQESIGKEFSEYLVCFDYLTRLLENYGFVLVPKSELTIMGFNESHGGFQSLFQSMKHEKTQNELENQQSFFGEAENMSDEEKQISFLNRYFIYKKVRDIPQATLNNMMELLGNEEKQEKEPLEQVTEKIEETTEKIDDMVCKKVSSQRISLEEDEGDDDNDNDNHDEDNDQD